MTPSMMTLENVSHHRQLLRREHPLLFRPDSGKSLDDASNNIVSDNSMTHYLSNPMILNPTLSHPEFDSDEAT